VFFEILCEHLLDAEFIATTSRVFANTSPDLSALQRFLSELLLQSGTTYSLFLFCGMTSTALYMTGLGNISVVWLLLALEWMFQILNTRSLYAHEYVIHSFIMLLCIIEIGQGRIKFNRFVPYQWKLSAVSGSAILLIKLQFFAVYFMAGLAKILSPAWSHNDVLDKIFLNSRYPSLFLDFILIEHKALTPYLIFAVKAFLICFPLAIMNRRLRRPAVVAGVLFHLTVGLKIGLYGFGFLMVSLYLLFFDRPVIKSK
jgi:hypothetical protein